MSSVDQRRLAEAAALDQAEIVDEHAFLVDGGGARRHRARRRAADVGVVAARGDPEQDASSPVVVEHRRADGDVGQVGAAVVGGVEGEHVAGTDVAGVQADDRLDRAVHRAEMDRHVRRVGDQAAVAVEDGAGEVEPLLDVDRIGGVLQRHAHLLGDRHEEVVEDLEHHRVGVGADRGALRQRDDAAEHDVVARGDLGLPAGLDDDGLVRLDDQRRRRRPLARLQVLRGDDRGVVPGAVGIERVRRVRLRASPRQRHLAARRCRRRRRPPPPRGFDDDRLAVEDEAELLAVRRLEGGDHRVGGEQRDAPAACQPAFRRMRDRQRRVGAVVAEVGADDDGDVGIGDALARAARRRASASSGALVPCERRAAGIGGFMTARLRVARMSARPMP